MLNVQSQKSQVAREEKISNIQHSTSNIAPLRGAMPVRAAPDFSMLANVRSAFNDQVKSKT